MCWRPQAARGAVRERRAPRAARRTATPVPATPPTRPFVSVVPVCPLCARRSLPPAPHMGGGPGGARSGKAASEPFRRPRPSGGAAPRGRSQAFSRRTTCSGHLRQVNTPQGDFRIRKVYGQDRIRLLRCTTCGDEFSERKGTALFGVKLPRGKAGSVPEHVQEGAGVPGKRTAVNVNREAPRLRHRGDAR